MNEEAVIFEVSLTYRAELKSGVGIYVQMTTAVNVRGASERDKLLTALRGMGFEPEWHYLNAPNAKGALDKLVRGFADFPPVTNA